MKTRSVSFVPGVIYGFFERTARRSLSIARLLSISVGLLSSGCSGSAAPGTGDSPLKLVADVPLPGGTTRFDYQSEDPATGRLYISHMGDGEVVVFDTKGDKVIASVPGFPEVTGVLVVPSLKALYASVARNHEIAVMETESLKVIKRVKAGRFPDGLAYAPEAHKVFISDESGGVETVIDTKTNERVDTIEMGGEVGNTQYDPVSRRIYACVQTRNEIVRIDPETDKVDGRYALKGGDHPHGFTIDDLHGRAYIACEGDDKLLVFNMKTHAVEAVFSVGDGPDVLAYDRGLGRLYVACESGGVSIFNVSGDGLKKLGDFDIGANSHTVSVDQNSHRVYFPLKNVNGAPALRIMEPRKNF